MADYKYCLSTRRIAHVEQFPSGSPHPLKVSVFEVCFREDISGFNDYNFGSCTDSIAYIWLDEPLQLVRILKCFGVDWLDSTSWEDSYDAISEDYEERKAELQTAFNGKAV